MAAMLSPAKKIWTISRRSDSRRMLADITGWKKESHICG